MRGVQFSCRSRLRIMCCLPGSGRFAHIGMGSIPFSFVKATPSYHCFTLTCAMARSSRCLSTTLEESASSMHLWPTRLRCCLPINTCGSASGRFTCASRISVIRPSGAEEERPPCVFGNEARTGRGLHVVEFHAQGQARASTFRCFACLRPDLRSARGPDLP